MTSIFHVAAAACLASALVSVPALAQESDPDWPVGISYETDIVVGDPDAPVTVVEYASLTCPHCANFHNSEFDKFVDGWVETGKARLIYRFFPLDQTALVASLSVSCLAEDQKMPAISALYEDLGAWASSDISETSRNLREIYQATFGDEFDFESVLACIQDEQTGKKVISPAYEASQNGVNATPYFFVEGEGMAGIQPAERLGALVDAKIDL